MPIIMDDDKSTELLLDWSDVTFPDFVQVDADVGISCCLADYQI